MTNLEYMIASLTDQTDDGGTSYEATVHYNVNCPYFEGDKRAHCYKKGFDYLSRENCFSCKHEWLNSEVDE